MRTFSLSMTTQRQVTFPKELVELLGLIPGRPFLVAIEDLKKKLVKYQTPDEIIHQVAGSLHRPDQKYISLNEAREILQQELETKYKVKK